VPPGQLWEGGHTADAVFVPMRRKGNEGQSSPSQVFPNCRKAPTVV